MNKRTIAVHNIPDLKGADGNWIRSYTITTDIKTQYHTRAGGLWGHIQTRCNSESKYVKSKQSYKNCSLDFEGFHAFAEWCQEEYGYLNREFDGKYWAIDKDILFPGNKSYSPITCMFVPNEVNTLFGWLSNRKGDLPIGVNIHRGKYRAYGANIQTNHKHLGYFSNPIDAHKAWQEHKILTLREYAKNCEYGEKICNALIMRSNKIGEQLSRNVETLN